MVAMPYVTDQSCRRLMLRKFHERVCIAANYLSNFNPHTHKRTQMIITNLKSIKNLISRQCKHMYKQLI